MKTLTLLRHAKSDWSDTVRRDFDRPLNPRGQRAARTMGREMRTLGMRFDVVIASPAARVVETLAGVAEGYGQGLDPVFQERVYLASPLTLLEIVHAVDDGQDSLLIVGHNPGLEALAMMLTPRRGSALREALELKYPTATLAEIALPVERWSDVVEGGGELARFIRPRDLDPDLGPDS